MSDNMAPQTEELEFIDQLLQLEDPEFAKSLTELKVGAPTEAEAVEIESLVPAAEPLEAALEPEPGQESGRVAGWAFSHSLKARLSLRRAVLALGLLIRTQPRDIVGYLGVQLRAMRHAIGHLIGRVLHLPWYHKILFLMVLGLLGAGGRLLIYNTRGVWLPNFQTEFISNYEAVADSEAPVDEEELITLSEGLPQPEYQVLLNKVVVNLRRRPGLAENPMASYEIYVGVDTNDAAIEIRSRQDEMTDIVARSIEQLSYPEVIGTLGVERVKGVVRDAMNQELTQGYVKNVYIKLNITKP